MTQPLIGQLEHFALGAIKSARGLKPGVKTTEFAAAQLLSLLILLGQAVDVTQLPAPWAGVLVVALQVAYIVSRGLAKLNAGASPASLVPDLVGELAPVVESIVAKHTADTQATVLTAATETQSTVKAAAAKKPRAAKAVAALVPPPGAPPTP